MARRPVKRMPRRQQKAVFARLKRGKTMRYSINYKKIFGKPIISRPILVIPRKIKKLRFIYKK